MLNQVPETDEDVIKIFNTQYTDSIIADNLKGIYRCRRGLGDSVLEAWEHTLRSHLEIHSENFKIPENVKQTIVEVDPHEIEEAIARYKEQVALDQCPVKIDMHFVFDISTFETVVAKDPDFENHNAMFRTIKIEGSEIPQLVLLSGFGGCQQLPEAIHRIVDLLKINKLDDYPWHVYIVEIDMSTGQLNTHYNIGRFKSNRRHS